MKVYRAWKHVLVEGIYSEVEWQTLCAKYDYRCVCCGRRAKLTPDHIQPTSKGGTNYIENIQPLCRECNSSKNDREIDFRSQPFSGRLPPAKKISRLKEQCLQNATLWYSLPEKRPTIKKLANQSYYIYGGKKYQVTDDSIS